MTGVDLFWRMRVPAYPTIDIFLLCFGLGNPESLQNIRDIWLREIRATCPDAQFLLIGLQADRRDVDSESWYPPVAKEKAISTAAELGAIKYVECSSKLNHGVREVFAEALLAGIEVVTAKNEQPTAALVPSFRTRLSIVRLPKKFLEFRGRLQGRREAERLQSVREEATDSSVQEDVKADAESQVMTITPEQQARASIDFEETLSRTWVYTHLDRRALLQASSMRDNATLTSRLHSSRETITPSRRSMLSVPMSWTTGDQRSVVSWGSAEHNATATLEIIEQYAANLESLQTELFDARFSPQTTQSYTNVSAGGHARMMLGNSYHHTTNHYVINYSEPSTKNPSRRLLRLLTTTVYRPHHRERGDGYTILNSSIALHLIEALSLRGLSLSSSRIPLATGLLHQCMQVKKQANPLERDRSKKHGYDRRRCHFHQHQKVPPAELLFVDSRSAGVFMYGLCRSLLQALQRRAGRCLFQPLVAQFWASVVHYFRKLLLFRGWLEYRSPSARREC